MVALKQLRSGLIVDLDDPDLSDLDLFEEVAIPLGRLARWDGHTADVAPQIDGFSVAQHCVVGADAVLAETGDMAAALAFVLHDAHEALIGDLTTPTVAAIATRVETALAIALGIDARKRVVEAFGGGVVEIAVADLKRAIDVGIHRLAGLPPPAELPARIRAVVAEMDVRMLDTERRQLMRAVRGRPTGEVWSKSVLSARPVRMRGPLRPWPARRAAEEWFDRFRRWRIRADLAA